MLLKILEKCEFNFSCLLTDSVQNPAADILSFYLKSQTSDPTYKATVYSSPLESLELPLTHNIKQVIFDATCENPASYITGKINITGKEDVVFTNISQLCFQYGVPKLAQVVRKLRDSASCRKLVAIVHTDVLPIDEDLQRLKSIFDVCIDIQESSDYVDYQAVANCRIREPSGKVQFSEEAFLSTPDHGLKVTSVLRLDAQGGDSKSSGPAGLTFNLSLSDNERAARNQVQLPYLKKESEKTALLNKIAKASGRPLISLSTDSPATSEQSHSQSGQHIQTSTSKIYYQYDEVDDFDDEDPDDDLDI